MTQTVGTRYGAGEAGGDYYFVKVGTMGGWGVECRFIDDFGDDRRVGTSDLASFTPEEVEALPSLREAKVDHLRFAFERAQRNRQRWLDQRPDEPKEPERPPRLDPATRRFFGQ